MNNSYINREQAKIYNRLNNGFDNSNVIGVNLTTCERLNQKAVQSKVKITNKRRQNAQNKVEVQIDTISRNIGNLGILEQSLKKEKKQSFFSKHKK